MLRPGHPNLVEISDAGHTHMSLLLHLHTNISLPLVSSDGSAVFESIRWPTVQRVSSRFPSRQNRQWWEGAIVTAAPLQGTRSLKVQYGCCGRASTGPASRSYHCCQYGRPWRRWRSSTLIEPSIFPWRRPISYRTSPSSRLR
jgi:hypothetical protein